MPNGLFFSLQLGTSTFSGQGKRTQAGYLYQYPRLPSLPRAKMGVFVRNTPTRSVGSALVISVVHVYSVAATSAANTFYLRLECPFQVAAGGRVDDVYDDHGSSDAGVLGKRVRGNDVHPVEAVGRSRTYQISFEISRHYAVVTMLAKASAHHTKNDGHASSKATVWPTEPEVGGFQWK